MKFLTLEENPLYRIDKEGNIWGPKGVMTGALDKGYPTMCIPHPDGRARKISKAKLVAKYLIPNPNKYKKLAWKDENPKNCHPSNLVWISGEIDAIKRKWHIHGIGNHKGAVNERSFAIANAQDENIRRYYESLDRSIIDNIFIELSRELRDPKYREIQGQVYLSVISMIERFALLYCPKKYIVSSYRYFFNREPSRYTRRSDGETIHS